MKEEKYVIHINNVKGKMLMPFLHEQFIFDYQNINVASYALVHYALKTFLKNMGYDDSEKKYNV